MDGSVLEEKSSFKMLGLTFSSKVDWGSYIVSLAKTASKKIGALVHSMEFFFSLGCSLSLSFYHIPVNGILLSCLGWCS